MSLKSQQQTGNCYLTGLVLALLLSSACISVEVNRPPASNTIRTKDREAITDLVSRYGHTWDNKNPEEWTRLFTEEADWLFYSGGELKKSIHTRNGRLNFAKEKLDLFIKQGIQTRHLQSNTILSLDENDSIHGETIFLVSWQTTGETAPALVHTGVYRDIFVRTPAGWKFSRREVHVDHE